MRDNTFKVFVLALALLLITLFSAKAENWDFSSYTKDYGVKVQGTFGESSGVISWSS